MRIIDKSLQNNCDSAVYVCAVLSMAFYFCTMFVVAHRLFFPSTCIIKGLPYCCTCSAHTKIIFDYTVAKVYFEGISFAERPLERISQI